MKPLSALALLALLLLPRAAAASADSLARLAEDFRETKMRLDPLEATRLGHARYHDRLDDNSGEGRGLARRELVDLRARLNALDRGGLAPGEIRTRDAIDWELSVAIERFEHKFHQWEVDAIAGPHVRIASVAALSQPMGTAADAEAFLARLKSFPRYMRNHIANLHEGKAEGRVASRVPVEKVIAGLEAGLRVRPSRTAFAAAAERLPDDVKSRYLPLIVAAVEFDVFPALRGYLRQLKEIFLPAARKDGIGLCSLPGGKAAYRFAILYHAGIDLTPEELARLGREELDQVQGERRLFAARRGPGGNQLAHDRLSACRLIVDVGIHDKGWSRVQALEFLRRNAPLSEAAAEAAVDRHTVWPGQALAGLAREPWFLSRLASGPPPKADVAAVRVPEARGEAGIDWVSMPAGSFMMGAEGLETAAEPRHRVTLRPFQIARTVVTVGQYRKCVEAGACAPPDPSCVILGDEFPAVCVDWHQAVAFSRWVGGRLPSEAEWEYAARSAGLERKYPWGDEEPACARAVFSRGGDGCGRKSAWPVCSKPAGNTVQGLCDMSGNVWQWTQDGYHDSYDGAPTDGSAWETPDGPERISRGGSWYDDDPKKLRTAHRPGCAVSDRSDLQGFRPVR